MKPAAKSLIEKLQKLGISVYDDPNYDNIVFNYKGDEYKIVQYMFHRHGGMCMTQAFIKKEKSGAVILKWVPITDDMFYELIETLIMKHFKLISK